MSMQEWLIFFLVVQLIHFAGTWKLYIKAGRKAWEAMVPIYNAVVLMKIINRPWWWVLLLFIPIINLIMFPVIWVETIRSFGRSERQDTILAIITLGLYIFYVNYALDVSHIPDRSLKPRTSTGEWVSSILFAVVAATMVHTYFMQPYVIPTPSLEKTLLVGDFLFVSKFHYGAKTPMTTVSLPMVHDAIPGTKIKSYVSKPQLPYFRLPGFEKIERNDIVVFHWPADTLVDINNPYKGIRLKPKDKRSNYVKRCVGVPGDSLEIRNGYVYINGQKNTLPDRAKLQFGYLMRTSGPMSPDFLAKRYGISYEGINIIPDLPNAYLLHITEDEVKKLKNNPNVVEIVRFNEKKAGERDPAIFPHNPDYNWNSSNFGPIYIPEAGKTVPLNLNVLPLYKRLITEYEGNTLEVKGTQVLINGEATDTYTFKQDYYWMMGDNRDNSQDARMWGYVPYDHVVGKPVFIWMSFDKNAKGLLNKIRWERFFTTVSGKGEPVSYFKYFLIAIGGWIAFSYFRKRKKKAA